MGGSPRRSSIVGGLVGGREPSLTPSIQELSIGHPRSPRMRFGDASQRPGMGQPIVTVDEGHHGVGCEIGYLREEVLDLALRRTLLARLYVSVLDLHTHLRGDRGTADTRRG